MRRVLVTGAAGFVGRWLLPALVAEGATVWGTTVDPDGPEPSPRGVPSLPDEIRWLRGDLRDDAFVRNVVEVARPDTVIHLAAVSQVSAAAQDPVLAWDVNVTATARLLHHLALMRGATGEDPIILLAGSAEQYGSDRDHVQPLGENAVLRPVTDYAATKVAMEIMALQRWRSIRQRTIVTRAFNHSGPGQSSRFLLPALVSRVRSLGSVSGCNSLPVGNLSPVRDFLHVRDVVAAYISLCRHGTAGEAYNIASGIGWSVREILDRVLARAGLHADPIEDPSLVRPVEVPVLVGDSRKLQRATGWRAEFTLDDIIDDLFHAETY